MSALRVACVQTTSTPDVAANLEAAGAQVRAAARDGAELILLPENVACLAGRDDMRANAGDDGAHVARRVFAGLARETGAWLLAGSIAEHRRDDARLANRSLLFDAKGAVVASYDKIHMFDVDLGEGESYRESASYAPGDRAVLAQTPWGALGMTVCYDLRFPQLTRALAKAGAEMLAIPSAFTVPTGRAHWHVLVRARAIECGCFVFAPAQCGTHYGRRRTYGHSLIVDPWGEVLAEAGEAPAVICADIDLARVAKARAEVPSFAHDRPFAAPTPLPGARAAE
jgi:predicted amidohydrolase